MSDLEIANNVCMQNIVDIAGKLNLTSCDIECFGNYKAKVLNVKGNGKGNVILVSAINPTPYGEGKTTVSIGIADAFNRLNESVCLSLREPSLGPVFGIKGGATGGGYSQVVPMEDINLHFTGDFHAITSANNLISAAIYNHIEQGNALDICNVTFNRCLDVNDRSLRDISLMCKENTYHDKFNITSASEIMSLFCLATDLDDLVRRLGKVIVGFNSKNDAIYVHDLKLEGALAVLLKDAFKPNLVQTLEGTPAIIHGGPFANIAQGCSSIASINLSRSLADYVVTEAGFGSDLGALKFLNILCPKFNIKPTVIVLVVTIRALKHNGMGSLTDGICNIDAHIDHLKKYNVPVIVCLNKFKDDSICDINYVHEYVTNLSCDFFIGESYEKGGESLVNLAKKIMEYSNRPNKFSPLPLDNMSITEKIEKISREVYHCSKVLYSDKVYDKLKLIEKLGLDYYPVCISKTQYSISDDASKLGYPKNNTLHVDDLIINNGAEFITVLCGNVYTMPGLPKCPNYENISLDNGKIRGLF